MTLQADSFMEPRKFVAPELVCGMGVADLAGRYAVNYGARKVLLVSDPGIVQAGWTGVVADSLSRSGIPYVTFDTVTANPKDHEVMAGADCYAREHCDVIVAVGGGSPMDCAKGIGIVATNGRSILTFEGIDEVPVPGPPLVCIPTTAGTGADVSQFAIIADTARRVKIAVVSKYLIPDVSLVDPKTTFTMDPDLTAATGMDALTHAIEAYVSIASSPITDLHALEAIRLIRRSLPSVVESPQLGQGRSDMMLGSLFAGFAFSNASLGIVHAMAHSLGGLLDLPHGECNAVLLEQSVHVNFDASPKRYRDIAIAFGVPEAEDLDNATLKSRLPDALFEFRERIGIPLRLRDLGLHREDLPTLIRHAMNDPCLLTNPKPAKSGDISDCYERAF
jgi:alcohol dehydrogenase class IV